MSKTITRKAKHRRILETLLEEIESGPDGVRFGRALRGLAAHGLTGGP